MFKPVNAKIDFPSLEMELLKYWEEKKIVGKYLHRNDKSKKRFSFFDGPITANNPMGVHHGWGRTYKDLWQRYYNMKGYKGRFQNGFDCQGLWVEVEVEKELGIRNKKDIENLVPGNKAASIAKFVNLCKERVYKFSSIQTDQSKRLGYFMDWEHSYFTMTDDNNYMIWHFLKVCHENGWIYKGHESVPWCPRCETAISEHEILTEDYKLLTHESISFLLPLIGRDNEYLLVWTTTPWTLPANIAVAVDEKIDYILVGTEKGNYWLAKDAAARIFKTEGIHALKILRTVKGKEMVGWKYEGPFDDLPAVKKTADENPDNFHIVIPTDDRIMPITVTEGTGMVHTAVSAGTEDFKLGKKLGLPMIPVIADNADYIDGFGKFSKQNAKKHPEIILDYLRDKDDKGPKKWVYEIFKYTHRYPACWRCKTELVWKVADEWYIAMDSRPLQNQNPKSKIQNINNNETLRERMIKVAKKIKWLPEFGLERELDWLNNMHDWLISKKNRYWGLALPIYQCSCGEFEVIGSREELKKKTVEGWEEFEGNSPHKPWIDEVKIKCTRCGKKVPRIDDVGNPWLDAGIISFSTLVDPETKKLSYTADKKYWSDWFPADFITESFPGQFKNWFYSLIAMSTVLENNNPFKTVLGYATLLGEDGRPMHKSWGNAVEFNEGASKIGVDVMRWMYVTQNPSQNMLFGYKKADEARRKFHLLLWNIYNFFVSYANAEGWKPDKTENRKQIADNILDKWILSKLNGLIKSTTDSLDSYDAQTASLAIEGFVTDLSIWYIRRSRDRIGPTVTENTDKNECYGTIYEILNTLVKITAPLIPFISEEIYRNLTGGESVHLTDWPKATSSLIDDSLEEKMTYVRKIVENVHARRKENKIKVRQPLGLLTITNPKIALENKLLQLLKDELNIKEIKIDNSKGEEKIELDTELSADLIEEGQAREIIRQIQIKRKEAGCALSEKINAEIPVYPEKYITLIKKETLTKEIKQGSELKIFRL